MVPKPMANLSPSQPPDRSSTVQWITDQLLAASMVEERAKAARHNPRPPGVIQSGSATQAVLEFLKAHPHVYFDRAQIVIRTGRTEKSVDWALIYLKQLGVVDTVPDESRNPRYLRYAVSKA